MSNPVQAKSAESNLWFLNLNRVFNHPVEDVFNAWTNPELLKNWFCNNGEAKFDVVEGGMFHVFVQCESKGIAELKGEYLEIIKNEKLVFTWVWQNEPLSFAGETVVTVEFIDLDGNTELKLLHEGFSSEEFSCRHTEGWGEALDRYERNV